ncbi:hypothetical protein, partial [Microbispora sp. NPDC049125]|uniref:hypothetical protein n=1 Tax=Microbispora sp. NPDC049125 TaxID=3154929 RepID=UPI0034652251
MAGSGGGDAVPSWVLVERVVGAVAALVEGGVPESAAVCLAEVEELLGVRDRLGAAVAGRVGRVHAGR